MYRRKDVVLLDSGSGVEARMTYMSPLGGGVSGGELDPRQPSTGARQGPPPTLLQEREGGRRQNDSCSSSARRGRERRLERTEMQL